MKRMIVLAALTALACNGKSGGDASDRGTPPPRVEPSDAVEATAGTAVAASPTADALPEGLEAGELFYGVYLQGNKVGWMRQAVRADEGVVLETDLVARVRGLGTEQKVELEERRRYAYSGGLESLSFEQAAATGATRVEGTAKGDVLELVLTAGGASRTAKVEIAESLEDVLAPLRLARTGQPGDRAAVSRFDASVQQQIETEYRVVAREKRNIAGVETDTVKIVSKSPTLGVEETAWYDETGTVLESRIGGFFVARLEPPDVAKKLDYSQDLLIAAVVKPPAPIKNPTALEALTLDVKGFNAESMPPETPRQRVTQKGDMVRISLSRDAAPSAKWSLGMKVPEGLKEFTEPTAFIQSDDPAIVEAAKRAVGDASELFTATSRLTEFVYGAIRDEYVPAYSNAKEALESGRGDCTEHAILFVALARALGIPSRVAVGVAYWPPGGGFGWHAWAEVHAGGDWIAVDPTWNQPIADATHLKLAGGGPAEQARIVMMLGQLQIARLVGG